MHRLLLCFCFAISTAYGQKLKKADKLLLANLQAHTTFLASDKLEGRRTGTEGEKLAAAYIENQFKAAGLSGGNKGQFQQIFEVNEGKEISNSTHVFIGDEELALNNDYFPFTFSANKSVEGIASLVLPEKDNVWFLNLKELYDANANNPHYDVTDGIKKKVADVAKRGASALIVYNTSKTDDGLKFEKNDKSKPLEIPVIYIARKKAEVLFKDDTNPHEFKIAVEIKEKSRIGMNVVGFKNNNMPHTIILGAHFDHLGYGEDHNSLNSSGTPEIHNGADDNASGSAALIELASLLSKYDKAKYNYLFVAFSGEELGLYGSKFFAENYPNISNTSYMVNMDMVGRLNESTKGLTIGGFGTSPTWGSLITNTDKYFTIKVDSSGTGPSDHTSFYRKDIPVLFFFTGVHSDYHKPSDDADKVNFMGQLKIVQYIFTLVKKTNDLPKLAFTKTKEALTVAKSTFKVSLGIMPDYTFSGQGVRADGVSEGKLAQKIGIQAGDVIVQLGNYKINDVQGYMEVLGKFNKGDASRIKIMRGTQEQWIDFTF